MGQRKRQKQKAKLLLKATKQSKVFYLNNIRFDFIKAKSNTVSPSINIVAYTGGALELDGFDYPIVIDLASTKVAPRVPVLWNHNRDIVLGHIEWLNILANTVPGIAVLSGTGEKAIEVRSMMESGYKFNVSAGTESDNLEFVKEGETRNINGQKWTGPFYHAMDNTIREVSILAIGADENAYAALLAASFKGTNPMTYEQWVASLGLDLNAMSDVEKTLSRKIYDNMMAAAAKQTPIPATTTTTDSNGTGSTIVATAPNFATLVAAAANDFRTQLGIERERVDKINILATTYHNPMMVVNGVSTNIASTAIRDNWDTNKTELEMMRSARPTNINAGGRNGSNGDNPRDRFVILAAALAIAGKRKDIEKLFTPDQLQAAHSEYKGRIGLQQLLLEAAYINGYTGRPNVKGNLKAILQAAFSTIDIADVLVDSANKNLRDGFEMVDQSWRLISAIGSVSDFKETTGYRGVGTFRFEKIAPDGHIPHGQIEATGYGNKADTYGKMLGITRQDIINDDLGILTSVPRGLGRGAAMALIHAFWTEFMDNALFFAAGNNNVTTGALGLAGIGVAEAKFAKQTDENGDFIMATPRYLVVPTELSPTADDIYTQTNLVGGGTTTFGGNRYRGKYQPVTSPYLSDARFTGNSTTAYYLLADPNDIPVIETVFLDGQQTPTVETADVDFDQLGVQMRGYFDFGVRKQEFRGGVRSTGA